MRSLRSSWRICAGTSIIAIATSPIAIASITPVSVDPSEASATGRLEAASPKLKCAVFHSIHAPTAPSSTTLSSDLPSSIQPCVPKMRFRPEAGFSLDGLGAIALGLNWSEPRPACEAMVATTVTANSEASEGQSLPPASSKGRNGSKSSTSAWVN